jgi:hypothetical protein
MSPIFCSYESIVNSIVRSACVLHNFVMRREGSVYQPQLPVEDTDLTDMVDLYVDKQDTLSDGPTTVV